MDADRKYKQRGYMDIEGEHARGGPDREGPRQQGPRPSIDVTGPRLPRLVQTVTATRCWSCVTALAPGTDFKGLCPKCASPLHCCKQCAHFEPSTRFQCLKPIPARIVGKDLANECELFASRVTVARDVLPSSYAPTAYIDPAPRKPSNARAAFDNLFKK